MQPFNVKDEIGAMGYYIDLKSVDIQSFKEKLKTGYLPPSRMILKEKLDERFNYFESIGLTNVKDLLDLLKNKEKFVELSKKEGLPKDYLTILLREIKSALPSPNKFKDFVGLAESTVLKLEQLGIKNSAKLFDRVTTKEKRKELADLLKIDVLEVVELAKLTDLSRIKWVGASFARMLYELGVDTVEKASKANPDDLHQKINQICAERNFYKGKIGLNDIRIFVEAAKDVPLEMKF